MSEVRFEQLLASYATWLGVSRGCRGMKHIEDALLTLVKREQRPPLDDRVLVALACVIGQMKFMSQLNWTKEDVIEKSAEWLVMDNTNEAFRAKELLHRLLVEYFSPESEVTSA